MPPSGVVRHAARGDSPLSKRPWTACRNLSQVASEGQDGSARRTRRTGCTVRRKHGEHGRALQELSAVNVMPRL